MYKIWPNLNPKIMAERIKSPSQLTKSKVYRFGESKFKYTKAQKKGCFKTYKSTQPQENITPSNMVCMETHFRCMTPCSNKLASWIIK